MSVSPTNPSSLPIEFPETVSHHEYAALMSEFDMIENNFAYRVTESAQRKSHPQMQRTLTELCAMKQNFLQELRYLQGTTLHYNAFQEVAQKMKQQLNAIVADAVLIDQNFQQQQTETSSLLSHSIQHIMSEAAQWAYPEFSTQEPMTYRAVGILHGGVAGGIAAHAIERARAEALVQKTAEAARLGQLDFQKAQARLVSSLKYEQKVTGIQEKATVEAFDGRRKLVQASTFTEFNKGLNAHTKVIRTEEKAANKAAQVGKTTNVRTAAVTDAYFKAKNLKQAAAAAATYAKKTPGKVKVAAGVLIGAAIGGLVAEMCIPQSGDKK